MEGDGKETGTGKGKMSCDHSHVPHALPHARNAYASTGPGLFGSSSSSDSSNSSMAIPDSVQRSRFSATQSQFRCLTPYVQSRNKDDLALARARLARAC